MPCRLEDEMGKKNTTTILFVIGTILILGSPVFADIITRIIYLRQTYYLQVEPGDMVVSIRLYGALLFILGIVKSNKH